MIRTTLILTSAGSVDADVHAVRIVRVVLSGSGDVSSAGNPAVTPDVSGSGDVSQR